MPSPLFTRAPGGIQSQFMVTLDALEFGDGSGVPRSLAVRPINLRLAKNTCRACGKQRKLKQCPCLLAYYCRDGTCQKTDWANHKAACKAARHDPSDTVEVIICHPPGLDMGPGQVEVNISPSEKPGQLLNVAPPVTTAKKLVVKVQCAMDVAVDRGYPMLAYNESRDTYFEIRKDNCVSYDQLTNTVLRKDPVNCKASPAHRICRFLSVFLFMHLAAS